MCDDSEGLGVAQVLTDPQYLKHFGYGPAAEQPKPKTTEVSATSEAVAPNANGTTEGEHKKANGITVERIAEETLVTKNIEIPQVIPKEVANTA